MENTKTAADGAACEGAAGPDRCGVPRRRTAVGWAGLVVLAVGVLLLGVFVGLVGPLFAIACDSCPDGVRGPRRFGDALIAITRYAVPLATLGTIMGMFHPRGGARVAGIGLGALVVLLILMVALGQSTA
ncbi:MULTISPECIES: hypothetical protein [Streptomyces]|uniref:DUF1634 domain-containing protein n=2 Tax=Streptomyces TaxID=1883 RepID=A0ABD5J1L7_9ACTN|nr:MULTISPECIES: hypothetical protein [Streptomyces]MEE4582260.1 hypothetical protein [Streptomyces sp. DSM 41602]WTA85241.1 hypothetical protein OG751_38285 [Streptomyces antimycoticus]AJZ83536.1 hypothetical protein AS97_13645 [Streptomyces sp. AgN23]RSS48327.1 hypothetical protein EF902_05935 [Streptomyces sp. WAC05858]WTB04270.1 hypothetical protein OG546_08515 [Streptomyces antimycoticus]